MITGLVSLIELQGRKLGRIQRKRERERERTRKRKLVSKLVELSVEKKRRSKPLFKGMKSGKKFRLREKVRKFISLEIWKRKYRNEEYLVYVQVIIIVYHFKDSRTYGLVRPTV